MPQDIEEPLRVTRQSGDRETVIQADSVHIGRTAAKVPLTPGLFPFGGAATHATEIADILLDPGNVPERPAVNLNIGDDQASGGLTVRDASDRPTITLNGVTGFATLGTGDGQAGGLMVRASTNGPVILITGETGRITFLNGRLETTLVIDGVSGDIEFRGADCAEDFEITSPVAPGSVMCVADDGRLEPCGSPYDRRVVGVTSGAGGFRPALRLDRRPGEQGRSPVAVVGKVECLVDATEQPIRTGDLLTTSSTPGHAMRAADSTRAFGAVIGKSLGPLPRGRGFVPILIALQ